MHPALQALILAKFVRRLGFGARPESPGGVRTAEEPKERASSITAFNTELFTISTGYRPCAAEELADNCSTSRRLPVRSQAVPAAMKGTEGEGSLGSDGGHVFDSAEISVLPLGRTAKKARDQRSESAVFIAARRRASVVGRPRWQQQVQRDWPRCSRHRSYAFN